MKLLQKHKTTTYANKHDILINRFSQGPHTVKKSTLSEAQLETKTREWCQWTVCHLTKWLSAISMFTFDLNKIGKIFKWKWKLKIENWIWKKVESIGRLFFFTPDFYRDSNPWHFVALEWMPAKKMVLKSFNQKKLFLGVVALLVPIVRSSLPYTKICSVP